MSSADTESASAALALMLLELPKLDALTESQTRGFTCVWDGSEEPLSEEAAIPLGPRRRKRLDGEYDWHPRGCPEHVGQEALLALFRHCMNDCQECGARDENGVARDGSCDTGRALLRLHMRKGRP